MRDNGKYQWMQDCAEEIDRQRATDETVMKMAGYICSFAVLIMAVGVLVFGCADAVVKTAENQERYYSRPFQLTQEQHGYAEFFRRHGSPSPEQMAVAVTATKRPALMSAIAVVESNGDPAAVGDAGDSKGAFQVQEKHWGEVSESPVQQALQAERILEGLLKERERLRCKSDRIRASLAAYNGGQRPPRVSYKYADRVMKLGGGAECRQ